ncbi:MAG: Fe-S cluster assembly sulfur transfer protein SufU [Filifactor alocis]|uniref:Fe-S cluster assembly sulfur transfer protein SufU n=1 Tax=Filifactor alocis TaxID=143361 RepID=UPI003F9FB089
MNLKEIYTQLILEESKNQENKRELENVTHSEWGHNPSCGDEINLQLEIEDRVIKDASFTGQGCAISQASTSIMISLIKGKNIHQAKKLITIFLNLIKKETPLSDEEFDELGDAVALENISTMPARVKCAVLAWHTLSVILEKIE